MKARQRERLAFGLLACATILVFETWASLDLRLSAPFHAGGGHFPARELGWLNAIYLAVPWVGRAMFLVALAASLPGGRRLGLSRRWRRRAVAMMLSMLVGLGLVVNVALKDQWGRPRPHQVSAFDGPGEFVPALHRSRQCERNCSFVSGHAATGFALIGLATFAAPRRRRRWLAIGIATGSAIGLMRVAQGSHFASDVVFALLVMWGTTLLLRELWLRASLWRRRAARRPAWRRAIDGGS